MRTRWPVGEQPPRPDVTSTPLWLGQFLQGSRGEGAARPLPWEVAAPFIPNKAARVQGTGARAQPSPWRPRDVGREGIRGALAPERTFFL